ncbi:MAG: hypothetical protein AAGK21_00085 [Bacteroidota bacterium]
MNAEVDIDSRILITFDRERLLEVDSELTTRGVGAFEAAVTITGRIGDRALEIPGYSVVGEEAKTAVARVQSGREVITAFRDVDAVRRSLGAGSDLDDLRSIDYEIPAPVDSATETPELERLRSELSEARARAESERRTITRLLESYGFVSETDLFQFQTDVVGLLQSGPAESQSTDAAISEPPIDPESGLGRLSARGFESELALRQLVAQIRDASRAAERANAEVVQKEQELDALRNTLAVVQNAERQAREERADAAAINREVVSSLRRQLLAQRARLASVLNTIAAPANVGVVGDYADLSQRNALQLRDLAASLTRAIDGLERQPLTDASTPAQYDQAASSLRAVFDGLAAFRDAFDAFGDSGPARMRSRLIYNLVDTSVLVRQSDARPGDVIVLTIQNEARAGTVPRSLVLRLTVREFGLVREVADSFLFLRRDGATIAELEEDLGSGSVADLDASLTTPRDVDFEPAPGVTLSWTFRPRPGGPWYTEPFRFLQPGFGVNVSFPQFGKLETDRTFTPGNPDEGQDAQVVFSVVEDSTFDIAVGGLLTLFDGALIITGGFPLTSRGDGSGANEYWGVGFSFVNIAQRIRQ